MSVVNVSATTLLDPYLNYRFRVRFYGNPTPVLGVSKVTALKCTTASTVYQSGGEPGIVHKVPGATTFEPITLERGVTYNPEFMVWSDLIQAMGHNIENYKYYEQAPLNVAADIRRDVALDLCDSAGAVVLTYAVYDCWVSSYQAMADLDGGDGNKVLYESLTLEHDGWECLNTVAGDTTHVNL